MVFYFKELVSSNRPVIVNCHCCIALQWMNLFLSEHLLYNFLQNLQEFDGDFGSFVRFFVHSFINLFFRSLIRSFVRSFMRSFVQVLPTTVSELEIYKKHNVRFVLWSLPQQTCWKIHMTVSYHWSS